MPWTEATPMDHRLQFVAEARRTDEAFAALCARHGIAPQTGYEWFARYEAEGPAGLYERVPPPHVADRDASGRRRGPAGAAVPPPDLGRQDAARARGPGDRAPAPPGARPPGPADGRNGCA